MRTFVLDLETAAVPNAIDYVEPAVAPANYKDPAKIAEYVRDANAERIQKAALDIDLAEIVAFGLLDITTLMRDGSLFATDALALAGIHVMTCDVQKEGAMLTSFADTFHDVDRLLTFNGRGYDLPLLKRRFAYLGLDAPKIDLDRYRSANIDVYDHLSYYGAASCHKLSWYQRRFDWTDLVSPIDGAGVGQAVKEGRWDDIRTHCACDLLAVARLAITFKLV
jgi:hypothetical protein